MIDNNMEFGESSAMVDFTDAKEYLQTRIENYETNAIIAIRERRLDDALFAMKKAKELQVAVDHL
jgi:hypothetical protein